MKSVRVSIVNYLNSTPFVAGLQQSVELNADIILDTPANSARKLANGAVDVALAPIAVLPELPYHRIITPYCIGTSGIVKTVVVFSEVPIDQIETIYLDYQSRTSVELCRIICKEHWQIEPLLIPAYPGYQKDITGKAAGLVIGDRAIRLLGKYPYAYDLAQEWHDWCDLPFVFATWIANKPMDQEWIDSFSEALGQGLKQRHYQVEHYAHLNTEFFSVHDYLYQNISYDLDASKLKAMSRFFDYLNPGFILNRE